MSAATMKLCPNPFGKKLPCRMNRPCWPEHQRHLSAATADAPKSGFLRVWCTAFLSGNGRNLRWQLVDKQVLELNFSARVIDIDSDEVTVRIVVEHDPFGNLPTFHTRLLREVYV